MSVLDVAQRYQLAGAKLRPAIDAAQAAVQDVEGWHSVASWVFRRAANRQTAIVEEACDVLLDASAALNTLGWILDATNHKRQQGEREHQAALQADPLLSLLDRYADALFDTPGESLIRQAGAEREAAFAAAISTLTALTQRAPSVEAAAGEAVEAEARKHGINARVTVEDGRITIFRVDNIDDLSMKQKWLALGLTPEGVEAQEGLREDWGYNDGLTSWKTWSPAHAAGRSAIAHFDGDNLRAVLEAAGVVPLPVGRAGGFVAKVISKPAAKVTAKVTAKAAPIVRRAGLPKIAAKSKKILRDPPTVVRTRRGPITQADLPKSSNGKDLAPKGMLTRGWLNAQEGAGKKQGHTLAEHVHITDAELIKRLAGSSLPGASRFFSQPIAERAIERVIAGARGDIETWIAQGGRGALALKGDAGRVVGYTIARGTHTRHPVRTVIVVIRRGGDGRITITSAYPDPLPQELIAGLPAGQLAHDDDEDR